MWVVSIGEFPAKVRCGFVRVEVTADLHAKAGTIKATCTERYSANPTCLFPLAADDPSALAFSA
jgi:hypothetical protein